MDHSISINSSNLELLNVLCYYIIVMAPHEEKFLSSIVAGVEFPRRTATNPLDDSYQANLLRGGAKVLTLVAGLCLDWKLAAIVKMLQSWLDDKEAEQAAQKMKTEFGYNSELGQEETVDNLSSGTYY